MAIERFFNTIKHFRAIAARFDKHDANYLASVKLAAAGICDWRTGRTATTQRRRWSCAVRLLKLGGFCGLLGATFSDAICFVYGPGALWSRRLSGPGKAQDSPVAAVELLAGILNRNVR
jgi:hypothetical protein